MQNYTRVNIIKYIAPKIGCVPQTLNEWVKRVEGDTRVRDGVTTTDCWSPSISNS